MAKEKGEKKGKSKLLLIIIIAVLVLVLVGGVVVAYIFLFSGDGEAETTDREVADAVYPLEEFIVNVNSSDGSSDAYVKVVMALEYYSDTEGETLLSAQTSQIRDKVIVVLKSYSKEDYMNATDYSTIQDDIKSQLNTMLGEEQDVISHVYFTDIIVQ
jgi:flagellar FliL protein